VSVSVHYMKSGVANALYGGEGRKRQRAYDYFRALGYAGTLSDMEKAFLYAAGFETGTLYDRWFAYLGSLGYDGTIVDRFKAMSLVGFP
jgi:hypothetical protein